MGNYSKFIRFYSIKVACDHPVLASFSSCVCDLQDWWEVGSGGCILFSLFPRVGASPLHVPREAFSLYSQELGRLLFMSQVKHFLFIPKSWGVSFSCPKRSTIFPLMVLAGWLYVPGSAQSLHGVAGGWG